METTTNFEKLANIFTNNINIDDTKASTESNQNLDTEEAKDSNNTKQVKEEKEVVSDKPEETKKLSGESEDEIKKLQKRLDESQAWGHKKNAAYVHAKKKVGEFLNKLSQDELLTKGELDGVLSYFDNVDNEETDTNSNEKAKINNVKEKLDNEFSIFKKYAKVENADDKYNAFFYFWPMLGSKEQEKLSIYFEEEEASVAIDQIMSMGGELYDNLYKGIEKHGGIIDYVKSLNQKNEKLQTKINELEKSLDNTTDFVHSRSINSKVQEKQNSTNNRTLADIWRNG
jgi:hypothetical protein